MYRRIVVVYKWKEHKRRLQEKGKGLNRDFSKLEMKNCCPPVTCVNLSGTGPLRTSVLDEQVCVAGLRALCTATYNGATLVALGEVFSSPSATACCAERPCEDKFTHATCHAIYSRARREAYIFAHLSSARSFLFLYFPLVIATKFFYNIFNETSLNFRED